MPSPRSFASEYKRDVHIFLGDDDNAIYDQDTGEVSRAQRLT